jgi:hypothetical protein
MQPLSFYRQTYHFIVLNRIEINICTELSTASVVLVAVMTSFIIAEISDDVVTGTKTAEAVEGLV